MFPDDQNPAGGRANPGFRYNVGPPAGSLPARWLWETGVRWPAIRVFDKWGDRRLSHGLRNPDGLSPLAGANFLDNKEEMASHSRDRYSAASANSSEADGAWLVSATGLVCLHACHNIRSKRFSIYLLARLWACPAVSTRSAS